MSAGSGRIFISYRRQETAWPARQLYEVLVARFGSAAVFKDVDDIQPGEDFVERITEAVASCDVLLALIGPQWVAMTDATGARRLDDPDDFVRLEIEAALTRGVRVVPILIDGATMPRADQLPPDMAGLARRQAVEINPVGFNTDRLMMALATVIEPRPSEAVPEPAGLVAPTATDDPPGLAADEPEATGALPMVPGPTRPAVPPEPTAPSESGPPQPARGPNIRVVSLVAGLAIVAIAAAVLVWHPWTGRESADGGASLSPDPSPTLSSLDGPAVETPSPTPTIPADLPEPPVLAHRGGLEHHQFETLQAMEAAARAGFAVETDVRYTKDGVAVLVHDERATKGLDCGGTDVRVSETTWADLRERCRSKPTAADPGTYEVPTLDATLEAIAAASPTSWVFLEAKTDLSTKELRAFLDVPGKYGLSARTVMTSFERDRLAAIRKADPSFRRMLFISGKRIPAAELKDDRLWAVAVEQPIATPDYVAELKDSGVNVMVWNPNEAKAWERVLEAAPDMVMSDYPEKYQEWLKGR